MIEEVENNYKFYGHRLDSELFLPRSSMMAERYPFLREENIYVSAMGTSERFKPELIRYIIENEDCLENLLKVFENERASVVTIKAFKNEKLTSFLCILKNSSLYVYMKNELNSISPEKREVAEKYVKRFEELVGPSRLLKSEKKFSCKMGEKEIVIDEARLANFFISDCEKILNGKINDVDYGEYTAREFMFAAKSWAYGEGIFVKYLFSSDAQKLYEDIKQDKIFDYFGVDLLNETNNEFTKGIKINDELLDYVFTSMPKDYDKLRKSIYVYVMLCKSLSYDSGFYASNQQGVAADYHANVSNIPLVSPENNEVVCYEFAAIFGEILNMIGLNYSFRNRYNVYGQGHANIMYKVGDIVIDAEPLKSVLDSDFSKIRFDGMVDGLDIQNSNPKSRADFHRAVQDVCEYVRRNDLFQTDAQQKFDVWKRVYEEMSTSNPLISLREKISIIQEEMRDVEGKNILLQIVYFKRLADRIFAKEKTDGDFEMIIMGEKVKSERTSSLPIVITAYKSEETGEYVYLKYGHDGEFSTLKKDELKKNIDSGNFNFINEKRNIPGLEETESSKGDDDE